MRIFKTDQMDYNINNGWFISPSDAYAVSEKEHEAEEGDHEKINEEVSEESNYEKIETEEGMDDLDLSELTNAEIREAAKIAGVGTWETARIETLKSELADDHR